ncbi:MAG: hypothetical protein Kow00121_01310 [Elainellaceae cyanobacterium]
MHDKQFLTSLKPIAKRFIRRRDKWSIGIYKGDSPFNFVAPEGIKNPVLTAEDVIDVNADIVADPFMVWENEKWYMFFEVMNDRDRKGMIGLATSTNGFHWTYQKIVLDEPFHLSYPYVFKWNEEYYMVPESYQANAIRLYKATKFPTQWSFVKDLLNGRDYVDSSIFQFDHQWWLFTTSTSSDILRLYYTDDLMGTWTEHPKSPVIQGNAHIARPGGRVVVFDNKIIRYTQDDRPHYGNQVRAFEITLLTTTHYQEQEAPGNPILKASGSGWNRVGMHNIDPHQINKDEWIACVDGYRTGIALK